MKKFSQWIQKTVIGERGIKPTGGDFGTMELSRPQITRLLKSCGSSNEQVERVSVGGYVGGTVSYEFDGRDTGMQNAWNEIPAQWRTEIKRDAAWRKAGQPSRF